MTKDIARRGLLAAGTAIAGGAVLATGALAAQSSKRTAAGKRNFEFGVRDLVYHTVGGKPRLARLYQPSGSGPFPAVLQIHGGAWNNKDRTDGQNTALDLAAAGIVVLSIDFRNAPEAPYPASLQDINYGIRWLKAHAREFGSSADRVGAYGTSTGGHQAVLSALRAEDPRYRALALSDNPGVDAKLAFVVSGWGVLYPLERRKLAAAQGKQDLVKSHDTFFKTEEAHVEATPTLILERAEKVYVPPALVFQGTKDEWTTVEQIERLAKAWRAVGGTMEVALLDGERHTFVNEHPFAKNSIKAMETVVAFVKRHGGAQA